MYYCDSAGHIIALTLGLLIKVYIMIPVVYMEEISGNDFIHKLLINVGQFTVTTILSMIFLYISQLHANMKIVIDQNLKLLDGMHEGLLVVSKKDKDLLFCNKPAQKLLTGAINFLHVNENNM